MEKCSIMLFCKDYKVYENKKRKKYLGAESVHKE